MEGVEEVPGFEPDPVQTSAEINPSITLCPNHLNQLKTIAPALEHPLDRTVSLPRVHLFPTSKTEC